MPTLESATQMQAPVPCSALAAQARSRRHMKAGKYDAAKGLMGVGSSFAEFNTRVDEDGRNGDELAS